MFIWDFLANKAKIAIQEFKINWDKLLEKTIKELGNDK